MKYAMKFAPVYGISESGYYSFDEDLNYAIAVRCPGFGAEARPCKRARDCAVCLAHVGDA